MAGSDDDIERATKALMWLALVLLLCVCSLAVAGTAYAVHRIAEAW